jgi:hypothetical protein
VQKKVTAKFLELFKIMLLCYFATDQFQLIQFPSTRIIWKWILIDGQHAYLIIRYKGWLDACQIIWRQEGVKGFFRGALPRVLWFVPASAISFMAVEWLRKEFNPKPILQIDTQPSFPIDITSTLSVPPPQSSTDPIRVNPPQEQETCKP